MDLYSVSLTYSSMAISKLISHSGPGNHRDGIGMSRALGDFRFKTNFGLLPEEQIVTANPDITYHKILEQDEFFILATDGSSCVCILQTILDTYKVCIGSGIWDCLTLQQAVDFVRYQVSEGKSLSEICEMMCDHCLRRDNLKSGSGFDIGLDNMTILIVAILQGRTKEEWYAWVTERVKNGYGYKTPTTLPQIYPDDRSKSFKELIEVEQGVEVLVLEAQEQVQNDDNEGKGSSSATT
jgi:protein phosphatase PTC2/3